MYSSITAARHAADRRTLNSSANQLLRSWPRANQLLRLLAAWVAETDMKITREEAFQTLEIEVGSEGVQGGREAICVRRGGGTTAALCARRCCCVLRAGAISKHWLLPALPHMISQ